MWHVFGKQKDYVGNAITDTFWINFVVINTLYSKHVFFSDRVNAI